MPTERISYQKRAQLAEARAISAEQRLENLVTVVIALTTLILGLIAYYNGAFAEGM